MLLISDWTSFLFKFLQLPFRFSAIDKLSIQMVVERVGRAQKVELSTGWVDHMAEAAFSCVSSQSC